MTYGPHCYISLSQSFLFTRCILSRSDQSQIVALCDRDLTIRFAAHKPCAHFTYRLYLRLLYLLRKRRMFFPQNSDLSSLCLIVLLRSVFAPSLYLVLPTPFTLSHCSEPPYRTISHPSTLRPEIISLLQNHTPQHHIGFALRSPIPLISAAS